VKVDHTSLSCTFNYVLVSTGLGAPADRRSTGGETLDKKGDRCLFVRAELFDGLQDKCQGVAGRAPGFVEEQFVRRDREGGGQCPEHPEARLR